MARFGFVVFITAFTILNVVPASAFHPRHGMPREPISKAGKCAKANMGVHIPYRGWRTRDRLGYRMCMWFS